MTIDANIIIAYLDGDERVVTFLSEWRQEGKLLFLPTVVEAEVLAFSDWTLEEKSTTEEFLEQNFTSIPLDRTIARLAAKIRTQTRIKLPDAIIAATALTTRTPLATRNERDFRHIAGLRLVAL